MTTSPASIVWPFLTTNDGMICGGCVLSLSARTLSGSIPGSTGNQRSHPSKSQSMNDTELLRRVVRERRKRRVAALRSFFAPEAKRETAWLRPSPGAPEPAWPESKLNDRDRGSAAADNPEEYVIRAPRNDYCQRFVDTGARPQNFIRDTTLLARLAEYPKLKELTKLKDEKIRSRSYAPFGIRADLKTFDLRSLECKFDVILIDAPLEEYVRRSPQVAGALKKKEDAYWTWEQIGRLPIDEIAGTPSFLFMWVGDAEGLDKGRELLARWGYRRCEDITWIKTNRNGAHDNFHDRLSVLQHTKEHCLMGMRGTARRSTDGHLIHCNVDTDVIIAEEPLDGSGFTELNADVQKAERSLIAFLPCPPGTTKPEEIYYLIERFALGRRRLQLFGGVSTGSSPVIGDQFRPAIRL